MPCYHPLTAWYSKEVNPSGRRSLVFDPSKALQRDDPVEISCGQCVGCRIERSRQWAVRCMHESALYDQNCFITLTFSPEELDKRENKWSLDIRDYQLFMKRLRKKFSDRKIRFFHCGEYGEKGGRPHYHAILFNIDFEDKVLWKIQNDQRYYTSDVLSSLWPFGFSVIGNVTFESAAYVARYVVKKVTGDKAEERYRWVEPSTGEIFPLKPEYASMSRRNGIGADWLKKYKTDVFPDDFIVVNGHKVTVPKYYDKVLEDMDSFEYDYVKERRFNRERLRPYETPERLAVREKLQNLRLERLKRNHDKEDI